MLHNAVEKEWEQWLGGGAEKPSVDRLQVQVAYHTCLSYEWHVKCTRVCAPQSISVGALELTQMCEFSHQVCNKRKQESE